MGELRRTIGRLRRAASLDSLEPRLVWIMGSPRSGSTWLVNLLAVHEGIVKVNEPLAAGHLGVRNDALQEATALRFDSPSAYEANAARADYVFADRYRSAWMPALRSLLLERFLAQTRIDAPSVREPVVLIKEPHGSEAAPLLFDVLPRARLLFLVRDARDVVDSVVDMAIAASGETPSPDARVAMVADAARAWVKRMTAVGDTFDRLPASQRILVRYEVLRADPVPDLVDLSSWLGLRVTADEHRAVADRLAFERVPQEQRGSGRFQRSAQPGSWRENLSATEQQVVYDICGAALVRFGYDNDDVPSR